MTKIKIIEDDLSIASELKEILDRSGYLVEVTEDFSTILDQIKQEQPNIILLDINLPKINGAVLLQQIRKESNVPVIMLTSKNSEVDEVLSMSYGADDYITKPYNPTILLLRIGAVLKRTERKVEKLLYRDLEVIPEKGILKKIFGKIFGEKNNPDEFQAIIDYITKYNDYAELYWQFIGEDFEIPDFLEFSLIFSSTLSLSSRFSGKLRTSLIT